MGMQWQQRREWATPLLWLMLLLLTNAWLNADTWHASNNHAQAYDDIDSFAEWLCETVADDDQLLPENTQDDQDEQSHQLHKYNWVKDLMMPMQGAILLEARRSSSLMLVYHAPLSKGFLQQHYTPPNLQQA